MFFKHRKSGKSVGAFQYSLFSAPNENAYSGRAAFSASSNRVGQPILPIENLSDIIRLCNQIAHWAGRDDHSKIGISFASTSSTITSGTVSSFLAPRAAKSSTRG